MRNIGNCSEAGWFAWTAATVPSVTAAPADGATVTTEVAGLDATVTVCASGFATACGLMSMVCRPVLTGLTSADGKLCNNCNRYTATVAILSISTG